MDLRILLFACFLSFVTTSHHNYHRLRSRLAGTRKFGGFDLVFPKIGGFPKMGHFKMPFKNVEQEEEEGMKDMFHSMTKPVPGVKTKVHNETKGNTTTFTVEQNGKGYHAVSQIMTSKNSPQMITEAFSEEDQQQNNMNDAAENRAQNECSEKKPCPEGQFCNPVINVCNKKVKTGDRCQFVEQCERDDNACIWGKCKEGKLGASGTLCQKDGDCSEDRYCTPRYEISAFYNVCSPKLGEGSPCEEPKGGPMEFLAAFIPFKENYAIETRESKNKNPCADGLVCAAIGLAGRLTCIPS